MREADLQPDSPVSPEDRALEARLRAAAAHEPVPAHLVARIERRLEVERRRRWMAGAALATAAIVIVALTVRLLAPVTPPAPAPGPEHVASTPVEPDAPPRVIVEPGPGLLAHRIESKTAGVTVVFLYRKVGAGPGAEPTSRPVEPERNET